MAIHVYHRDAATVRLPMIARDARLVVWPGVGAITANMNYVAMEPGEANVPHSHPVSEDTIVVFYHPTTCVTRTVAVSGCDWFSCKRDFIPKEEPCGSD